jgi:hypothetical protein
MKPTLKKILHISTLDEEHISVHNTIKKPSSFADKVLIGCETNYGLTN